MPAGGSSCTENRCSTGCSELWDSTCNTHSQHSSKQGHHGQPAASRQLVQNEGGPCKCITPGCAAQAYHLLELLPWQATVHSQYKLLCAGCSWMMARQAEQGATEAGNWAAPLQAACWQVGTCAAIAAVVLPLGPAGCRLRSGYCISL